jgi:hypothetical protein
MSHRSSLYATLLGVGLLLPAAATAQSTEASPPRLHYWLAAGAGAATVGSGRDVFSFFQHHAALAGVASLQYRNVVFSARAASAGLSPTNAWDVGLLAGLGTSPLPAVSGSIGAGIARQDDTRGHASVALPLELQLTWRLTRWIGAGVYGFGSFGGSNDFLGATFMVRVGRLR